MFNIKTKLTHNIVKLERKPVVMSNVLVDFWDFVTGEPGSIIDNPIITKEDGKTYTNLNNYYNESNTAPKRCEPKLGETAKKTKRDGLFENKSRDVISDFSSIYSACSTTYGSTERESYETDPSYHQISINSRNDPVPEICDKGVNLSLEFPPPIHTSHHK